MTSSLQPLWRKGSKWVEESFRKWRTAVCCWSHHPPTKLCTHAFDSILFQTPRIRLRHPKWSEEEFRKGRVAVYCGSPPAELFTQSYIESCSVSDSKDRFTTSVLQPLWRTGSGKEGLQCAMGPHNLSSTHIHGIVFCSRLHATVYDILPPTALEERFRKGRLALCCDASFPQPGLYTHDDDDCFYTALFSALQQTHCARLGVSVHA